MDGSTFLGNVIIRYRAVLLQRTAVALTIATIACMSDFKKCPNGHYYQGDQCPYCKSGSTSARTEVFGGGAEAPTMKTEIFGNNGAGPMPVTGSSGAQKTTVVDGNTIVGGPSVGSKSSPMSGRTVFGDDDEVESVSMPNGGERVQRVFREARKIVGWLVSYTLDPMGVDFKLYEGRNIIGRDMDCNITVNDGMVSSKHAVILFRAGKYSITDSQSSHGTFVNDEDIELEPHYLQDGDIITIGQTVFRFRTSF